MTYEKSEMIYGKSARFFKSERAESTQPSALSSWRFAACLFHRRNRQLHFLLVAHDRECGTGSRVL